MLGFEITTEFSSLLLSLEMLKWIIGLRSSAHCQFKGADRTVSPRLETSTKEIDARLKRNDTRSFQFFPSSYVLFFLLILLLVPLTHVGRWGQKQGHHVKKRMTRQSEPGNEDEHNHQHIMKREEENDDEGEKGRK